MYKSPLLKAVKRHTKLAVLTQPLPIQNQSYLADGHQNIAEEGLHTQPAIVKARWLPSAVGASHSEVLTPAIMPDANLRAPASFSDQQLAKTMHPPEKTSQTAENTDRLSTRSSTQSSTEDSIWKRLQTIFNRHQEKEQQEESLVTDDTQDRETSPSSIQPETFENPEVIITQPARGSAKPGQAASTGDLVQRKETDTPKSPPAEKQNSPGQIIGGVNISDDDANSELESKRTEESSENMLSSAETQLLPQDEKQLVTLDESVVKSQSSSIIPPDQTRIAENLEVQDANRKTPGMENKKLPDQIENTGDKTKLFDTQAATKDTPEEDQPEHLTPERLGSKPPQQQADLEIHTTPLQAAWPVQESTPEPEAGDRDARLSITESDNTVGSDSNISHQPKPTEKAISENQEHLSILNQLKKPEASKSNSSIEYLPPRRPRPDTPIQEIKIPAHTIQRQPVEQPNPAKPSHQSEADISSEIVSSFEENLVKTKSSPFDIPRDQPQPSISQTSLQPLKMDKSSPMMYSTEIGELPADLWKLIGEAPPMPSKPSPTGDQPKAFRQSVTGPAESSQVMRATEALPNNQEFQEISAIQTQAETPPSTQKIDKSSPAETSHETANQDIDIPELARKVYSEIKARLAIEWERSRYL